MSVLHECAFSSGNANRSRARILKIELPEHVEWFRVRELLTTDLDSVHTARADYVAQNTYLSWPEERVTVACRTACRLITCCVMAFACQLWYCVTSNIIMRSHGDASRTGIGGFRTRVL